jgi:indole-3-glycerol phosphate synthase
MKKVDTLTEIIQKKKERILLSKQQILEEDLKAKIQNLPPARPFIEAINKPRQISLIAEIKKASPSRGVIRQDFNPQEIAKIYQDAGVQAISILTEEDFFQGNTSYINEIKSVADTPILRKDFILEPYQIYESRFFGADAILLIADLLSVETLSELIGLADSLDLDCLVEVHTEKELKKVLNLKVPLKSSVGNSAVQASGSRKDVKKFVAFMIGINNRDLHTLEVDFKTTQKLFPLIPKDKIVVVESGIKTYQDVLFLKILGTSAVLIGEAFMEAVDIRKKIEEVMGW